MTWGGSLVGRGKKTTIKKNLKQGKKRACLVRPHFSTGASVVVIPQLTTWRLRPATDLRGTHSGGIWPSRGTKAGEGGHHNGKNGGVTRETTAPGLSPGSYPTFPTE